METVIISGKGGTGKSSIVAAFASLSKNVILADCDVDAANMNIIFPAENAKSEAFAGSSDAVIDPKRCDNCRLCIKYCRFGALQVVDESVVVSDIFCDGCGLCTHVCPKQAITLIENKKSAIHTGDFRYGQVVYGALAPGEENSGKLVSLVREKAKDMAARKNLDIIIDGPPGIGCPVIASVTGADKAVIIAEASMSGLNDLRRIWSLCKSFRINTDVVINKYDLNITKSNEIEQFCIANNIRLAGKLPFDIMFVDALTHCKSVVEWVPGSKIVTRIKEIFDRVLPV